MSASTAEQLYRRGRSELLQRRPEQAHKYLRAAIEEERRAGVIRPQMRYLSYYGLSVAMARGGKPTRDAVGFCEEAAAQDPHDPELLLNLGRIYLMSGKTTRALAIVERGLRMFPGDPGFRALLARLDRRSPPVVRMLHRDHPINRSLGRVRAALFSRGKTERKPPHRSPDAS